MRKISLLLLSLCLFIGQGVIAQAKLEDPLPKDSKTIIGKLPNGITYYIRHNEEPKNRASFYIIRNAGALLEEPEQDGLAHFLEHMSFQGTKNFPGKGIISTLERYGVAFGREINAYTSQNETVYNLSSIPTNNHKLLDTCVLMLHDWSYYLTLSEEEIDAERGVISEEWRTRRTSDFRLRAQIFPVLFKGSKYAIRDVIGSLDVIQHHKPKTIRDFYHKWYRTDLEAVAIVGDFDVKEMEERVKRILSTIPAIENPTPRPFYEIPSHKEPYFVVATDKEAQGSSIDIYTILKSATKEQKQYHEYIKNTILTAFYNTMAGMRIYESMHQANPPYMNASLGYSNLVRGYDSYCISANAKPNEEAQALEAVLIENERILRYGFTASELERTKANILAGLQSAYKDKDKTNNDSYVEEMQSHFLEGEPIVDFEYYYKYVTELIPTIKVEEVNALAKKWNNPENVVVAVSGPSEGVKHLTEEETFAIIEKVKKSEVKPYQDATSNASLISEELKGGKIVKTTPVPMFDAVEWELDNGAKVVFRHADFEKDNIALYACSEGGINRYDIDMLPSAENAASMISNFGLGDFDAITLNKILTGKMASTQVSFGGLQDAVSGSSTPQDIETMFQMIYLRFEKPRFDKEMFSAAMNKTRSMLPIILNQPQKKMQDTLKMIMTDYNPRTLLLNENYLNSISFDKIEQVYRDRIKDASDFTFFIVGNTDEETVKSLATKYIGSIKSEYRKEHWVDSKVRGPKGKIVRKYDVDLQTAKSTVITQFSKDMKYNLHDKYCNTVLKGILDLRFTTNIREKEGGTYGVSVQSSSSDVPYDNYSMTMTFECDPSKDEHLKSLIYKEIEAIQAEVPTEEEVHKVVSNLLKGHEQNKNHNGYWLNTIVGYYIDGINANDPKNCEDILKSLTPKDIQKFAKKLFKDADIVDLIFTSKGK